MTSSESEPGYHSVAEESGSVAPVESTAELSGGDSGGGEGDEWLTVEALQPPEDPALPPPPTLPTLPPPPDPWDPSAPERPATERR
jgi:hypothetical protein